MFQSRVLGMEWIKKADQGESILIIIKACLWNPNTKYFNLDLVIKIPAVITSKCQIADIAVSHLKYRKVRTLTRC